MADDGYDDILRSDSPDYENIGGEELIDSRKDGSGKPFVSQGT